MSGGRGTAALGWLLAALLGAAGARAADEELPRLRFDPFAPSSAAASLSGDDAARSAELDQLWAPTLNGTLLAGPASMANLGGIVLRIGEEAHGYRLLEVRGGAAVFERAGVEVVLTIDGAGGP